MNADKLTKAAPYALAILRIVAALLFLAHPIVKFFGFPPGAPPGPQEIPSLFGAAGLSEIVTGTLILVGWFTRPAAFIASGEMAIGYFIVHAPQSFYPIANMGEPAILFCFVFLYLVFAGPGALSVDGESRLVEVTEGDRAVAG